MTAQFYQRAVNTEQAHDASEMVFADLYGRVFTFQLTPHSVTDLSKLSWFRTFVCYVEYVFCKRSINFQLTLLPWESETTVNFTLDDCRS